MSYTLEFCVANLFRPCSACDYVRVERGCRDAFRRLPCALSYVPCRCRVRLVPVLQARRAVRSPRRNRPRGIPGLLTASSSSTKRRSSPKVPRRRPLRPSRRPRPTRPLGRWSSLTVGAWHNHRQGRETSNVLGEVLLHMSCV